MDEQQGFLQAIIEQPEDDTHRLVFADWLDEHGNQSWAQLIRGQCALARLLDNPSEPFSPPGSIELMSLVPQLRTALLRPFDGLRPLLGEPDESAEAVLAPAFSFHVRRGLIEALEVYGGQTVALFARNAEAITEQVPLRHLRIKRQTARGEEEVYLSSSYEPLRVPTLRSLLGQAFVTRLETLDLRNLGLRDAGARALLRHRDGLRLRQLHFDGNHVTAEVEAELRGGFGDALVMNSVSSDDIPF